MTTRQEETARYINREPQLDLIQRAIKTIRLTGPIFQTVYEFTGIPGIGKTVLISLLHQLADSLGVPVARLDFDPEWNPNVYNYARDPVLLLQALADQLVSELAPSLQDAIAHYSGLPPSQTYERDLALDKVVSAFRDQVDALSQRTPPLFLFDSTDQAPPAVLAWLEERLVSPLSQKGRCIFVFAGRSPLHWSRFEVRRRVYSERLGPFESGSVKELLTLDPAHPDLSILADQVYGLTAGYPLGSSVVHKRLAEILDRGEIVDDQTFPAYEPDLLDELVREAIDAYVFRGVKPELADACRVLALLRQFDVILLRKVLSEFVPDFKEYPRSAFGGLLGLLHATHLIEWDDGRKGYNVAMPLRRILSQYMRQRDPQKFVAVNQAALEVYQDWIERVSENRPVYIIEALYHQANINLVDSIPAPAAVDLEEQFQGYLACCYTLANYQDEHDLLGEALNRLGMGLERDTELQMLLDRLGVKLSALQNRIAAHRRRVVRKAKR